MTSNLIYKTINWLLYSNVFIAICAWCMVEVTRLAFHQELSSAYAWGLFFGTWSLYAWHRYFGILRISEPQPNIRYEIITSYRSHILLYAVGTGIVAGLLFVMNFDWNTLLVMLPAAVIGGMYVAPVFQGGKRLRDYDFIKIILISLIWSWLTVIVPLLDSSISWSSILILAVNRFLFIFAITLPFDIRDLEVDKLEGTRTIPMLIGIRMSKVIAIVALAIGCTLIYYLYFDDVLDLAYLVGAGLTYLIAMVLILVLRPNWHDYFYTGVMDGLMIIYCVLVMILDGFIR